MILYCLDALHAALLLCFFINLKNLYVDYVFSMVNIYIHVITLEDVLVIEMIMIHCNNVYISIQVGFVVNYQFCYTRR
ncbi:hypothetical protein KFK09_008846 [Dendrobium nobile]|uniref:Uncharacterized protein n=1 Tax=Dendrobium nobile TaxID=94219 RepID=A0A8T3BL83_DENNO|nr:hypothetical protein KFK09_022181 [Dendrobium nobile]KAI0516174.1 hypothetical protein KFK09_008846 [Dendrobium nobile]